jgi:hypothetical protein
MQITSRAHNRRAIRDAITSSRSCDNVILVDGYIIYKYAQSRGARLINQLYILYAS